MRSISLRGEGGGGGGGGGGAGGGVGGGEGSPASQIEVRGPTSGDRSGCRFGRAKLWILSEALLVADGVRRDFILIGFTYQLWFMWCGWWMPARRTNLPRAMSDREVTRWENGIGPREEGHPRTLRAGALHLLDSERAG